METWCILGSPNKASNLVIPAVHYQEHQSTINTGTARYKMTHPLQSTENRPIILLYIAMVECSHRI